MNLDQVLNSIEDKDITEIRNSLESQLNQRVDQQTNFQSTNITNNGIFTPNSNDFSISGGNNNRIISNSTANNIKNNSITTATHPASSNYLQKQRNLLNGSGMQANENNNNSKTFILNSSASGGSNNSHIFVTTSSTGTTMPTNEPVKLVYPVSGTTTSTSGGIITTGKSQTHSPFIFFPSFFLRFLCVSVKEDRSVLKVLIKLYVTYYLQVHNCQTGQSGYRSSHNKR